MENHTTRDDLKTQHLGNLHASKVCDKPVKNENLNVWMYITTLVTMIGRVISIHNFDHILNYRTSSLQFVEIC